jgi:hypothetical protein
MARFALGALAMACLPAIAIAFSTGGGQGNDDNGNPFLQACDALYVCQPVCPAGMTAVAPPVRSSVYQFRAVSGATTYEPDELTPFELSVTSRTIQGKRSAGTTLVGNETAKYLGILLYAVDRFENKVGRWEIPLEANGRFWAPPDPGCEGRSLMHADAELKNYRERFIFRAPPTNTGPITFRVLVKQGETNKGAFYWPSTGNGDAPPAWGVAGGDLTLQELVALPPEENPLWISADSEATNWAPQSCTSACRAVGLSCNESALLGMTSDDQLLSSVQEHYACMPPMLAGCESAPRMSGLGDGFCWYRNAECPAPTSTLCDEMPAPDYSTSVRFCACSGGARRARRTLKARPKSEAEETMEALVSATRKELRLAAERTAAQVAAAGGCPSARLALRKDVLQGGDGSGVLASAAACPKYYAARIAAAGGLNSDTADVMFDWSEGGLSALTRPPNPREAHEDHMAEEWWLVDESVLAEGEGEDGEGGPASELEAHDDADGGSERAAPNQSGESTTVTYGRRASQADPPPARTVRAAWAGPFTLLGFGALLLAGLLGRRTHVERPRHREDRRGGAVGTAISLMAMLTPTDAHNWMAMTRRRGGYASTVKPYPPGGQGMPGYKLNRGQPFNFGFVAGHGGPTYFAMVHSDDLEKLKELNHVVMEYYINTAPPSAHARYAENGVPRKPWRKYHLSSGRSPPGFHEQRGMRKVDMALLKAGTAPDAPVMMWPGDNNNWWTFRNNEDEYTMYEFPDDWAHFSGDGRVRDKIVAYTNSKFPWIQVRLPVPNPS